MSLTPPSIGKYRLAYQARPWRGPWASSAGCPCRWRVAARYRHLAGPTTAPDDQPAVQTNSCQRRACTSTGSDGDRRAAQRTVAARSLCVQPSRRRSGLPLVGGHGRRRGAAVPAVGGPGATEQSTDHDEPQGLQQPELDHDPEASVHQRSLPYWLPRYGPLDHPAAASLSRRRRPTPGDPTPQPAVGQRLPAGLVSGSGTRPDHHPTFDQHDRQLLPLSEP